MRTRKPWVIRKSHYWQERKGKPRARMQRTSARCAPRRGGQCLVLTTHHLSSRLGPGDWFHILRRADADTAADAMEGEVVAASRRSASAQGASSAPGSHPASKAVAPRLWRRGRSPVCMPAPSALITDQPILPCSRLVARGPS